MKVLYVDINLDGHRLKYLNSLVKANKNSIVLMSENDMNIGCEQIFMKSNYDKKRNIINYIKWIHEIIKISQRYNVDIVHFLCGDALYRFFGIGLSRLPAKIVVTYHHMTFPIIKKFAIKRIFKKSDYGIVHTEKLLEDLQNMQIKNCRQIEYPMLDFISTKTVEEAKKFYNVLLDIPILGVIGGTSKYKGLDFLIEALNKIDKKCCLFVAGKEINFNEKFIKNALNNENVILKTCIKELTNDEFADAVQASDMIMLPYRKEFDGASGILIESLFHGKHVIGSNHGSMGDLIKKYELGRTFETNSLEELVQTIEEDIENPYELSEKAIEYKEKMSIEKFLEENRNVYEKCYNSNC